MKKNDFIVKLERIAPEGIQEYPLHFHFFENSKKYDSGKIMEEYIPAYCGKVIFTPFYKPISKLLTLNE